jgi:hypothetical protein
LWLDLAKDVDGESSEARIEERLNVNKQVLARFVERLPEIFKLLFTEGESQPDFQNERLPLNKYASTILTMRYVYHMRFKEIAQRLGLKAQQYAHYYFEKANKEFFRLMQEPKYRALVLDMIDI